MSSKVRAPLRRVKKQKTDDFDRNVGTHYSDNCPSIDNVYQQEVQALSLKYPEWSRYFDSTGEYERFSKVRQQIEEETAALVEKYAWAIPDDRSLKVIAHFSPIIEIGCGKGYWARLLKDMGVDVVAYDKFLPPSDQRWTDVRQGGPEVLKKITDRTLLLCYPDEAESIAAVCLDNYAGEYVIHVGELHSTGTAAGAPVAPFGRTSSAEFQVQLSECFHCVLVAELTMRYPISRDCISVWKRTRFLEGADVGLEAGMCGVKKESTGISATKQSGPKHGESNPKKVKQQAKKRKQEDAAMDFVSAADLALLREAALDVQYSEDQDNRWAVISPEERLPVDRAAPALSHLLS
eukprot:gene26712-32279_t